MIFEVGRVCMKLAGRDANKYCAVTKVIDTSFVEIDGQTRRRKCNVSHLEPLDKVIKIKEGANNSEVAKALTEAGFETKEKSSKSSKNKQVQSKKETKSSESE